MESSWFTSAKKFKSAIDLSNISQVQECVIIDLGSLLSEYEVELQFGTSPIAYRRKYFRVYAHRKGKIIRLIVNSNVVLEFEAS